ncbi:MAG TPA: hypothetical protein VN756_12460 [Solirubrobacterales bacterium]|nr:hypothetical protein [Solirubrobacterales bacterium]
MRDPLLNEALRRLAAEAATRFSTLVASGDQLPFDVAEQAGPDEALFHSYVPLTARYVREHETELRSLPAFEPAREAIELAGVAAPYLEQRGEVVSSEPGERAARLLTVFMASLWDGCTEFSLDRERLAGALAVLDAEAGDIDEADVVVIPVVGLQMPLARLQLPHGAQLVRADTFDAPIEAMRSEGMGRAAWEPQFLAIAEQGEGADSAAAALRQLGELVSVMRLFKRGGIGLGPHAFAPTGEGRWRRIATGAPAPRSDGYKLNEEEAAQLTEFAQTLEARPDPAGPLAWAVQRFEMACERPSALEGLSDHLLALRAVLDGQGPVGASLPMRAAALIADGSTGRLAARERIEAALELERAQMSGAPTVGAGEHAAWVEECVRRILREAALGELGTNLNEAADETLIATGLDAGDVEIAVAAQEPDVPEPKVVVAEPEVEVVEPTAAHREPPQEDEMNQDTRILEPVPAEHEIRITATDWLDEVEESTLDFPAVDAHIEERERIDTPRVRHLFPVPEDADWEVRELKYDHYDRHAG